MRREFARQLHELMAEDEDIILLVGDLGYLMFDAIRRDYPDRFFNVGAAEHTMMAMAVGLAMRGKKPVVYSITPFVLFRAMEVIRNYVDHESIPVVIVGSGRDDDYKDGGFSHYAGDHDILKHFENIDMIVEDEVDLSVINWDKPTYINLKR